MNQFRGETQRIRWYGIPLIGLIALVALAFSDVAQAVPTPFGCKSNGLTLTISRVPSIAAPGGTDGTGGALVQGKSVAYQVTVANGPDEQTEGQPTKCDIVDATVKLSMPDPVTGLPTTTPIILASGVSFPADGSGNMTYAPVTFTVPKDGTFTGINAQAKATIEGNLLDDYVPDLFSIEKTVSASIVDAGLTITPATATNRVGDQHVFTIQLTAKPGNTPAPTFGAIVPSVSPAPSSQSSTCATPTISAGGSVATCTVTINSATPGAFTVNAAASVTFGSFPDGLTLTRDTNPVDADGVRSGGRCLWAGCEDVRGCED